MKKLPFISALFLMLTGYTFAQAVTKPDCPAIELFGPSGNTAPGDPIKYSVKVDANGGALNIEYVWSVSSGEIISGQGTSEILIKGVSDIGNLTTTVKIEGLREGCPNAESESMFIDPPPQAQLIETFRGRLQEKDKTRLDKFVAALETDPSARGVIFFGGTPARIKANKRILMELAPTCRFSVAPRITLVDLDRQNEFLELWIVPAGANEPDSSKIGDREKRP